MQLRHCLPLHLLLLLDASLVLAGHERDPNTNFLTQTVHKARRHSKGLVDDLRIALGAVLDNGRSPGTGVSLYRRDQSPLGKRKNVLFCKSNNQNGGGHSTTVGGDSGGNGTRISSGTGGGPGSTHSTSATTSPQQTTDKTRSSTTTTSTSSSDRGGQLTTSTSSTPPPNPTPDSPYRLSSSHVSRRIPS